MQVGDRVTIGDEFYSYTLRDPRKPDVIRYVGSTSRPSQRLSSHLSESINAMPYTKKQLWICQILVAGLYPVMVIEGVFPNSADAFQHECDLWGIHKSTAYNSKDPTPRSYRLSFNIDGLSDRINGLEVDTITPPADIRERYRATQAITN